MYLFLYSGTEIKNALIKNAFFSGGLFLLIFYLISTCTRYFGMSMASMFNKSGYMLPLLFSYLVFSEKPNGFQWAGSILGLGSLALALWENKTESGKKNYLIPLMVIIGSGIIDTLMLWNERMHFQTEADALIFSTLIFSSAYILGSIIYIYKYSFHLFLSMHNAAYGALLGIPNFFSIFFLLLAIQHSSIQKSVLFGVNNVGIVFSSIMIGVLVFLEAKNKYQWLGIAGLLLSMACMNLNLH
jgi:drug/metabolite transporter (DMT)-like permease